MLYQLSYSRAGLSFATFGRLTRWTRETARAERMKKMPSGDAWPPLPYEAWKDTLETLHLFMQIPGKVRLALAPPEPEWNHVTLYAGARGLTTSPIPYRDRTFEMTFDFIWQKLVVAVNDGKTAFIDLKPRSVADFYAAVMTGLRECGIEVAISDLPQEVPNPIRFHEDTTHASYDAEAVGRFWRALSTIDAVFKRHRAPFRGRHTPVQLWWGSFDHAYERFSGAVAEPPANVNFLMRTSLDACCINAGFWPGDGRFEEPAFYCYVYPKPDGLESAPIRPASAGWNAKLGEFLLRYEDVRQSPSPEAALLEFLESTYSVGAKLAGWDPALAGAQ
jgi:hypothetical protein